jgi:hypothetical protein
VVLRDAVILVTLAVVGFTALRIVQAAKPRPPTPRVPARARSAANPRELVGQR